MIYIKKTPVLKQIAGFNLKLKLRKNVKNLIYFPDTLNSDKVTVPSTTSCLVLVLIHNTCVHLALLSKEDASNSQV